MPKPDKPIWNVTVAKAEAGYSLMHAPLVVKDKVIVGTAGGEFGIRGFLAAYDARTGKEAWRFNTIPGPGEPGHETWAGDSWMHGGASVWVTGSYDPQLNLTYWGIGNPGPDWNSDVRAGTNLYSDSVVALDADTGKLKWYFQFSPHDDFDYDSVQVPVLADMEWKGKLRRVMLWANRNGFYYVLDRTTGEFLQGKPFAKVTWTTGLDDSGKPVRIAELQPDAAKARWSIPACRARRTGSRLLTARTPGSFTFHTWENYSSVFNKLPAEYVEGRRYTGGRAAFAGSFAAGNAGNQPHGRGRLWSHSGVRSENRRSQVGIQNGRCHRQRHSYHRFRFAVHRRARRILLGSRCAHRRRTLAGKPGGDVASGPMTFSVNGRQYVSVSAGNSLFTYALRENR